MIERYQSIVSESRGSTHIETQEKAHNNSLRSNDESREYLTFLFILSPYKFSIKSMSLNKENTKNHVLLYNYVLFSLRITLDS